jgi:hypothetical protein
MTKIKAVLAWVAAHPLLSVIIAVALVALSLLV